MTTYIISNHRERELVAYYLRYPEKTGLESSGATGDEGSMGLGKQVVSLVINNLHILSFDELCIIVGFDTRSPSEDNLIISLIGFHGLQHRREIVLDLLLAAPRQQSDYF